MLRFHGQNQQPGADEMPVLRMPLAPGPQPPTPPPLGLRHEGCGGHRGAAERHLLGMTASVGGKGSGRKTNRGRGRQEVGHRCGGQEAVSGGGQAGGWLSWGWPPGTLWLQARVGPLGSSSCIWKGNWTEKTSLAGCHHQRPPILGLTILPAGWPKPGPRPQLPLSHHP